MLAALVSIHDVMPETLDEVTGILTRLVVCGIRRATLLVVPGRAWSISDIARLRRWQEAGHMLAGHGWHHRIERFPTLYARAHGAILSRRSAEHLALDGPAIAALMDTNHAWFAHQGLARPSLYVPPAWALGKIGYEQLAARPFRFVETLGGVHDTRTRQFHRLPLVGFEADTALRALLLRASNASMYRLIRQRPLRVAIHPADGRLYLAEALTQTLADIRWTLSYPDLTDCTSTQRCKTGRR